MEVDKDISVTKSFQFEGNNVADLVDEVLYKTRLELENGSNYVVISRSEPLKLQKGTELLGDPPLKRFYVQSTKRIEE